MLFVEDPTDPLGDGGTLFVMVLGEIVCDNGEITAADDDAFGEGKASSGCRSVGEVTSAVEIGAELRAFEDPNKDCLAEAGVDGADGARDFGVPNKDCCFDVGVSSTGISLVIAIILHGR